MVKGLLKQKLADRFPGIDFDVLIPPDNEMGDYSTNIAFVLATHPSRKATEGKEKGNPVKIGEELAEKLRKNKEFADIFEKIEVVKPGFVNFFLKKEFLQKKLAEIASDNNYGFNETMKGKTIMVEYTDPNPFKLFHIGHLMSNTIGEAIARLHEASGAKVLRANYQGDVGLHVAKAILGWKIYKVKNINPGETIKEKMDYLGRCYTLGSAETYAWLNVNGEGFGQSFLDERNRRTEEGELDYINKAIYEKSDEEINDIYTKGREWSLEYFEIIYKKLGTKFDRYFFESEAVSDGLSIVKKHPNVFIESDGAKIFNGEEYGLHTRVFVSSKGLPTYETKELGVNKKKFEKDKLDLSIIVTGNEINDYFKVLLKVMELTMPEVAEKTKHISHGMLRLPRGKMSSRTGEIITADSLIEQTKAKLPASPAGGPDADSDVKEKIAIGAIKYSILKQSPGHDIIFDFEKSLSIKGDSGPYLQYTYARLANILIKSNQANHEPRTTNLELLNEEIEIKLIKQLLRFPDVVIESSEQIFPQHLALYLYELANIANRFYESIRVLDDEDAQRRNARLVLISTISSVLKTGLKLLGIESPDRI